ncbi:mediator of RNA polymerase II transcription subunit 22-like [Sycon ciliatum]|uniref:mediator of RNA polymerase II transcription subunit 22-like n=1 Tax=Sycon ciliatum TaxID=27933 RepID=UPI0020ABE2EE|eukprot:scpid101780/ scgid22058/ Mediator of RNA polymerase II transcription subunit 22; Mediator complex subunit 22; Surfeit locus protein 5
MSRPTRTGASQLDEVHLTNRLREAIKSLLDNFTAILKSAKIEDESQIADNVSAEHSEQQMQVRASNMVRASEALLRLTGDIKECLILNDLPALHQQHTEYQARLDAMDKLTQETMQKVRNLLASDLQMLQEHS